MNRPEDVSILGFCDLGTGTEALSFGALIKPELTAIAQRRYQIGQRATEMVLGMLTGSGDLGDATGGEVATLKAELCVRRSVTPHQV